MFEALVVAAAIAAPVNQPVPELQVHVRAESSAAISASLRIEPLRGELAIRESMAPGVRSRDVKSGAHWTSLRPFELVYEADAGVLRLVDGDGSLLHERHLSGLASVEGPNLLRVEVGNLDGRATVRLESLVLRTGDLERPVRAFGRGVMTHDLATVWEPALADGFRLSGVLATTGADASDSNRVWVDFGLGRGRRIEVVVEGEGSVVSEPARLGAASGKSSVAFFGLHEPVTLRAAERGGFLGWRTGDRVDASPTLVPGADDAVLTAIFEATAREGVAAGGSPLGGGVFVFTNDDPITVPAGAPGTTQGPADPYPSTLFVGGPIGGAITDVNVKLDGVTHTHPDDFDVAVVSPFGTAVMLMSDACGPDTVTGFDWTFDDEAAAPMTDDTQTGCVPFFVQPSNYAPADTFPAPGPTSTNATLAAFDAQNPNGTWQLFVFDDAGVDVGAIESGWDLIVTTEPYVVLIPATGSSGTGDPYPSTRNVSPSGTFFGTVLDANITLVDMTHEHGDDLDVLVQGPVGHAAILMSDACGSPDFNNYIWTFDDEAAAPMSDSDLTGCNPFVVQPTNYGEGDTWPAPAPAGTFDPSLTVFDGTNPFGTWNLWINDDAGGDVGFLETDWSVDLTLTGMFRDGFETADTCEWSSSVGGSACP